MRKEVDKNVLAFRQHGFSIQGESGNEAYGPCPFCLRDKHFYVNKTSKNWSCKSCGRQGGYQIFLKNTMDNCCANFKGKFAIDLSKSRGIKLSILREFHIGYNMITNSYIIPIFDYSGNKIWDLRIHKTKGLKSTSGCTLGLLNWDKLQSPEFKHVWLCEGEWDCMIMTQIIKILNIENTVAIGVPGAGTFKTDWNNLFINKDVYVVYDNDLAGIKGTIRINNSLSSIVDSIKFIHWPEETKNGYDLTDLFKDNNKNPKIVYSLLNTYLQEFPIKLEDSLNLANDVQINIGKLDGPGLSYKEVYKGFTKWLELPDTNVLDILFGTIIANRLPGDPLWLFLVAPSGGTKTELIMSLFKSPKIVTTTNLTPPALVSGANVSGGLDPSLLRIMNENILAVKDFTTILCMLSAIKEEIFGILRDVYDGRFEKRFGNGVYRKYDPCRFGIIAGVTPAIELYTEEHVALGERFLRYRVKMPLNTESILRKALLNTTHEETMRSELQDISAKVLNHEFRETPDIPNNIIDKIIQLAQWTSLMRSTIARDKYTKEITHSPFTELGTRLAKQFCKELYGIGMFRQSTIVTNHEYNILKQIARSTVPSKMECVLKKIISNNASGTYSVPDIIDMVRLPKITTERILENLSILGILKKVQVSRFGTNWIINDKTNLMMEKAEIFK